MVYNEENLHERLMCRMGRFSTGGECSELGDESDRSRYLVTCLAVSLE